MPTEALVKRFIVRSLVVLATTLVCLVALGTALIGAVGFKRLYQMHQSTPCGRKCMEDSGSFDFCQEHCARREAPQQ